MKERITFIFVMLIFGSIGIFVKQIDLFSAEIAFWRGMIGSLFLIIATIVSKSKFRFIVDKSNRFLLLFSGIALGFNWIFLFESYRYTTVTNATFSYYFAPVFVMMLAPFLLKEKFLWRNFVGIFIAMMGLLLVLNPEKEMLSFSSHHIVGIIYGLLAAILYASVIIMNKFLKGLSGYETTIIQLVIATFILCPYVFFTDGFHIPELEGRSMIFLIILGIVHTGIAYALYFPTVNRLKGQTVAIFSYVDPISAVIMSTVFLSEQLSLNQIVGGIFILISPFISELKKRDDDSFAV